LKKTNKKKR